MIYVYSNNANPKTFFHIYSNNAKPGFLRPWGPFFQAGDQTCFYQQPKLSGCTEWRLSRGSGHTRKSNIQTLKPPRWIISSLKVDTYCALYGTNFSLFTITVDSLWRWSLGFQDDKADLAKSYLKGTVALADYHTTLERALEKMDASRIIQNNSTSDSGKVEVRTVGCSRGGTANISPEMQLRSVSVRSKIFDPFDPYPSDHE